MSININELRVGKSIIKIENKIIRPHQIDKNGFISWVVGKSKEGQTIYNPKIHCNDERFSYVPITRELLLNSGFEEEKYITNSFIYENFLSLTLEDDDWNNVAFDVQVERGEDYIYLTSISYIHELQNLFLGLMKYELNIKL